jgi:type IV secretory pathway VirB6-like protein
MKKTIKTKSLKTDNKLELFVFHCFNSKNYILIHYLRGFFSSFLFKLIKRTSKNPHNPFKSHSGVRIQKSYISSTQLFRIYSADNNSCVKFFKV